MKRTTFHMNCDATIKKLVSSVINIPTNKSHPTNMLFNTGSTKKLLSNYKLSQNIIKHHKHTLYEFFLVVTNFIILITPVLRIEFNSSTI